MLVIVVGGGRTGSHLAGLLLAGGHEVRVVEDRPEVVELLRRELPPEAVVPGDGADPDVLERAGIRCAAVVAAVTGDDEDNLVVATLARFEYAVRRVIARVNNPRNSSCFFTATARPCLIMTISAHSTPRSRSISWWPTTGATAGAAGAHPRAA